LAIITLGEKNRNGNRFIFLVGAVVQLGARSYRQIEVRSLSGPPDFKKGIGYRGEGVGNQKQVRGSRLKVGGKYLKPGSRLQVTGSIK
jgi:hypothetical protein